MTAADIYALMPIIILAGGSVICLLAGAIRPGGYLYCLAGSLVMLSLLWSLASPCTAVMPGLSITAFSRFFIVFLNSAGLIALLLASGYNKRNGITGEEYPATILFALTGMGVASAANNLLMLFLGLEAFTFAFYILVAIKRDSVMGGEAGLKYLLNGTLSAAILAMGMALLYTARGTIRLAELAVCTTPPEPLFMAGAGLILLGMAFKLSLVPAHLWTPDVYQGAPAPVSALLSTASKGASLAALLLLLPLLANWRGTHDIIWCLALFSMLTGNLAALRQTNIKRMLAWSSIGQMGYVALALVVAPTGGVSAALFYVAGYSAAGLAAFGAVALLSADGECDTLDACRGLGERSPLAGAALAVAMFSLAGIPPTAGFIGKFGVFRAALHGGETVLALIGILSALIAVFFYLRVVVMLYMKSVEAPENTIRKLTIYEIIALAAPTSATILLGVYPQPLLDLISRISIAQ
ncbi:MAG: NADH-quinone oxidoreductase subunit N [Deltaproteobacteria bacterium]|nr:NADH-quinone oxidoreductase subunit N [Deltaproteobacteria bacterium]